MKNLKAGDVVSNGDERTVLEVLTNTALLSRYDDPTEVGGWYTLDELKDYTLVQPKKTLEEKFREYLFEDDPETVSDEAKHLAQIAEEHYSTN